MKTQNLSEKEMQETNGGSAIGNGLLGNDSNTQYISTGGYVGISSTDDQGRTSSHDISFGDTTQTSQQDGRSH